MKQFLRLANGADDDAEFEDFPLCGPTGGIARVSVGERGRRSSTWRVFSNAGESDVYISARTIVGIQKFSLHESGIWRHAFNNDEVAKSLGAENRLLDRWVRPEMPEHGWTKALNIWVPHGHVDDLPQDPPDSNVLWVPEPAEGHMRGIQVVIAAPDKGVLEMKGTVPIDAWTLPSGGRSSS